MSGIGIEVQLTWDPSDSPDVVAYRLYETESTNVWPIGWMSVATKTNLRETDLTFAITNLSLGTHRWVLTAITAFGVESDPSNEAALTLEKPSPPLQLRVGSPGTANTITTLQRSFDLQTWEPVYTWTESTNSVSFFRLQLQNTH
jgi:hypothetical protein